MMTSRFQNFGEVAESGLWRHGANVEVSKEARRFKSCSLRSFENPLPYEKLAPVGSGRNRQASIGVW